MTKITLIQAGLFAVLIGAAPFAFAGGNDPAEPEVDSSQPTDAECMNEWKRSWAVHTCHLKSIVGKPNRICHLDVSCPGMTWSGWANRPQDRHIDHVSWMINCNGYAEWRHAVKDLQAECGY